MKPKSQLNRVSNVRTTMLPSARSIPVLGQGTWMMGDDRSQRRSEIEALRLGLDLGMTLIDTAEMYGEGKAEELIGEAIKGYDRKDIFIVTKVYPHNASRRGAVEACARSLRRLQTDYIDLYLLHWRGNVPLLETLEAFQSLKEKGEIRGYGVSNFDVDDMEEAFSLTGGEAFATNQVLYNLAHRGIEWDLMPWCRRRDIPIMAYSPLGNNAAEQHEIFRDRNIKTVAARHDVTPAQIALAWLLRHPDIVVIPKASRSEHVRANRAALDIQLSDRDLKELDQTFPAPHRKTSLEML